MQWTECVDLKLVLDSRKKRGGINLNSLLGSIHFYNATILMSSRIVTAPSNDVPISLSYMYTHTLNDLPYAAPKCGRATT